MKWTVLAIAVLLAASNQSEAQSSRSMLKKIPTQNIAGENAQNPIFYNAQPCIQSYYTINLTGFDISLADDKTFWNNNDPFVVVAITVGDKQLVNIIETGLVEKNMETLTARSVVNRPLIGPFPYKGENIKVVINLYAYKTSDDVKNTLDALSGISKLFPNEFSNFVEVSTEVKNALDKIFSSKLRPKISYEQTWNPKSRTNQSTNAALQKGYFVIFPSEKEIDPSKILIDDQKQIKIQIDDKKVPLFKAGYNYVVLEFDHYVQREDLPSFAFYSKFTEAFESATYNQPEAVERSYTEFKNGLYGSDNFTLYDKVFTEISHYQLLKTEMKNQNSNFVFKLTPPTPMCVTAKSADVGIIENEIRKNLIDKGIIQPDQIVGMNEIRLHYERLTIDDKEKLETQFLTYHVDIASIFGNERAVPISGQATAKITLGKVAGAAIIIAYTPPSSKGRKILGELVPFGQVWRTGSNEATTFEIDRPIKVEGKLLAAGKYALFTIPGESEWTIIFNKEINQWGAYKYNSKDDALRVNVKPQKNPSFREELEFDIAGDKMRINWENTSVPIEISH